MNSYETVLLVFTAIGAIAGIVQVCLAIAQLSKMRKKHR